MKKIIGLCGIGIVSGCTFIPEGSDKEAFREKALCAQKPWYRDKDGDGFGGQYDLQENGNQDLTDVDAIWYCQKPATNENEPEFVSNNDDCDDLDELRNPDAIEDCNTLYDDDCDGDLNAYGEADNCTQWYADADGDGYGSVENSICDCVATQEFPLASADDCNDINQDINPGMEEICGDGIDNNCDRSANGCGLSSPHDLGASETIYVGTVSKDYAGARVSSGALLSDDVAAVILSLEADSTIENLGRIDVLEIVDGEILTSESAAQIWATQVSSLGSSLIGNHDIDGDGNHDLLVGAAYMSSNVASAVGAVSIFLGPLEGEKTMNDFDYHFFGEAPDDRFGDAASIWNGASTQVWIGAPKHDVPLANGGSVFIFDLNDGDVQSFADAVMIDSEIGYSRFGTAISQAMDANGDGIEDMAVGARSYSAGRGSAYVFWGEVTANRNAMDGDVIIRGLNEGDEIGSVIDFVGEMTGSGYAELALGSPNSNKVYLLSANTAGEYTTSEASVVLEGPVDSQAGYSLANVGDVNGDGQVDLAVGAVIASSVYLLYGPLNGTYNLETDAIILQDTGADQVGSSLVSLGDIQGDGLDDFLVGAKISSRKAYKSGSAFVVLGDGL